MPEPIRYGLDNPHPLSQMKTELIWAGKYDAAGRKTAPVRVKLPFQTVETVNESSQERQLALDLFSTGREAEWRNRLIWGDKKYVLPALLEEFAGQVDLVYIDPPFNVGADFSFTATIPNGPDADESEMASFLKEPSAIEVKAYRDTWGRGLESYLQWFYDTGLMLRELLKETGCLYVHLDWRVVHYVKAMLDEVFGNDNFMANIIWKRIASGRKATAYKWLAVDDIILVFTKGNHKIKPQYQPYSEEYKKRYIYEDERGPYFWDNIGTYSQERLKALEAEGRIKYPDNPNAKPRVKNYLWEGKGVIVDNIWTDIPPVNSQAAEDTAYPTQKPEALLERIIQASSNEDDLILDCFCGSGTTAAVAEKLNRRWITCDLGRFAIHTARKRLLSIENVKPFVVQNLGKYERQAWQAAEFGGPDKAAAAVANYRRFILDLYGARPLQGYAWLHGLKHGRMVHVGAVDAPISPGDVTQIALEFRKAVGRGADAPAVSAVDVLGWDFAFELNEVAKQQAAAANIAMRFLRIPREVLEKQAVEQGDIKFFELAALAVTATIHKRGVDLALTDFVIPPDDVPADIQRAITHWSQWIDYWAVDWDNQGDTFHNMWQTYRTRKDKSLVLRASHQYAAPGTYRVMVKVIDILGNDTTKTLQVTIG